MAEYIDREAAIAMIRENGVRGSGWSDQEREDDVIDMIESIPAADVRPVVLCRGCKMQQHCKVAQYLGKDGFCSNGEKDVRLLGKCKLYKDCEYRTLWNCCCEDCNMWE